MNRISLKPDLYSNFFEIETNCFFICYLGNECSYKLDGYCEKISIFQK